MCILLIGAGSVRNDPVRPGVKPIPTIKIGDTDHEQNAHIRISGDSFCRVFHAESWDMPMAFPDSNCHGLNGKPFKEAVGVCPGGDLTITVHAGGSRFGGSETKRAVQTEQAPIGERLLSAHRNEKPVFGIGAAPLLATSHPTSDKLWVVA